jgi:peptide/nickel transport system substrate-binding protein
VRSRPRGGGLNSSFYTTANVSRRGRRAVGRPRQRLESIGFKVILRGMDFSTNLVARARKEPPDKGGWNLLHTWWHAADVDNPAVHFGLSGAGPRAWFGWRDIPQIES